MSRTGRGMKSGAANQCVPAMMSGLPSLIHVGHGAAFVAVDHQAAFGELDGGRIGVDRTGDQSESSRQRGGAELAEPKAVKHGNSPVVVKVLRSEFIEGSTLSSFNRRNRSRFRPWRVRRQRSCGSTWNQYVASRRTVTAFAVAVTPQNRKVHELSVEINPPVSGIIRLGIIRNTSLKL